MDRKNNKIIIGIDLGRRRIGLSASDPLGITAQGAGVIDCASHGDAIAQIKTLASRRRAVAVVVGLPLSMDGSEGAAAREARRFGAELEKALRLPVTMWDERLTTLEAHRAMKSAGLSRKKRSGHVDEVAAQIILQSYLDNIEHNEK